jgi:hypothetical protein
VISSSATGPHATYQPTHRRGVTWVTAPCECHESPKPGSCLGAGVLRVQPHSANTYWLPGTVRQALTQVAQCGHERTDSETDGLVCEPAAAIKVRRTSEHASSKLTR